ncbi:hypothetical protein [Halococcoides cellulosivorans]|uniref:Uncharacterized protein n=1 Tax=Halococcoides cellulosivorans TaxID=1679096 RepID=A0A2R4X3R7_9EURY|nr:hypothetical protein [Halococcoides cellulosivorans]AWB28444.1 hypothetical protein HARCEL1_12410 [Halococcoides cellulosivorans]
MIDPVINLVSRFDLPTAVVSVILGFLLKMVWDVVSSGLKRRRQAVRDDLEWYHELRALARRIALAHAVTKTYTDKFDVDREEMDMPDVESDSSIPEEAAEHMEELFERHQEAAYNRQLEQMDILYDELLTHVSTTDVDLSDEMREEIENLLFHTFMGSLNKFEVPEDNKMPAEKGAEVIVEMCDDTIDEMEKSLSVGKIALSRLLILTRSVTNP